MARMRWLLTATIVVFGMGRFASAREVDPKTAARSTARANSNYVDLLWQRLPPLLRGVLYISAERHESGIAVCDEVLKTDPNNPRAYELRGWAYLFQRKNLRPAVADFSEAVRRDPDNTVFLIARGRAYQSDKEYDRAIADYTQAIRMDPRCAEARAWRGRCYLNKKVTNKGIADFTAALKLDPGLLWARCDRGEAYRARGEPERALTDLEEVLKQEPYHEKARRCRCSAYLCNMGDYDRAIADANEFIEKNPKDARWYLLRGGAYMGKGEVTKGLRDETTAARLDPQGFKFRWRASKSGMFTFSFGTGSGADSVPGEDDSGERVDACTKRLASDPNNVATYYERACAYFRKREYKRAIADFDEIIRRDPEDAAAYSERGSSYDNLKEYAKATADYTKAIRMAPDYADNFLGRAYVYAKQGQIEKALRDSAHALQLDPQIAKAHLLRGYLYHIRKDYAAALAEYTEAIRLCPTGAYAYMERAGVYAHKGDYPEAIADYKQAVYLNPRDMKAHRDLGWYLATCPDEKLRNGEEAGAHAFMACYESNWREPRDLDTYAAAYAECGQFEDAVKWQAKALELAKESDKAPYRQRLELYQAHKPYRLSSPSVSASSSK